jgi:hypothetical protein
MASGIHCDGPACANWTKSEMATKSGFLTVFDGVYPMYADFVAHFCSWDCVMKYASFKETVV